MQPGISSPDQQADDQSPPDDSLRDFWFDDESIGFLPLTSAGRFVAPRLICYTPEMHIYIAKRTRVGVWLPLRKWAVALHSGRCRFFGIAGEGLSGRTASSRLTIIAGSEVSLGFGDFRGFPGRASQLDLGKMGLDDDIL